MCSNSRLATLRRSGASLRGLDAKGGPVVCMWCWTECLTGGRDALLDNNSGNSFKSEAYGESSMACTTDKLPRIAESLHPDERVVLLSMSLFLLMSTSNSLCCRKSAPMIGCVTSATVKIQTKLRRKPKEMVRERLPYVFMLDPFAALSAGVEGKRLSVGVAGMMLQTEPLSMRKV